ncbi:MAG: peptidoglycan recognition protein family protein [Thainema sp.]
MVKLRGALGRIVLVVGTAIAIILVSIQPWSNNPVRSAYSSANEFDPLKPSLVSPFVQDLSSTLTEAVEQTQRFHKQAKTTQPTTNTADQSAKAASASTSSNSSKATQRSAHEGITNPSTTNYTTTTEQPVPSPTQLAQSTPDYVPATEVAWADPTNYGERYATDAYGNPVYNDFIVVLHETVGSADSAINTFRTPHPRDEDQVSYHTLIRRDGTVVYTVPPEKRAFGAGNSVFDGPNGSETVVTNLEFPGSVNNFAYHISLESPSDGRGNSRTHSGYTDNQYRSLAWLVAQSTVPDYRITTHRDVDRSGSRLDPRSFNGELFLTLLHQYARPA